MSPKLASKTAALQSLSGTSVGAAISAWQVRLGSRDLFVDDNVLAPLRASSIVEKGKLLAQFVCCVHDLELAPPTAGPKRIFTVRNLERALEAWGAEYPRRRRYFIALAVKDFSANWLKVREIDIAAMESMCRRLRPKERGLSAKNHSRLVRHLYAIKPDKILDLPFIITDRAADPLSGVRPVDVATAAYLTVLFYCPMPISQIRKLQLGDIRKNRRGWLIEKASTRVRSRYLISYQVSGNAAKLIGIYLKQYRPKLRGALRSDWLFPGGRNHMPITNDAMRLKIKQLYRHVSTDVDVRLLRWLIGCYYLTDNPGDLEGLKHLLGFSGVASVAELYDSFRNYHLFAAYHEKIGAHRLSQSC